MTSWLNHRQTFTNLCLGGTAAQLDCLADEILELLDLCFVKVHQPLLLKPLVDFCGDLLRSVFEAATKQL